MFVLKFYFRSPQQFYKKMEESGSGCGSGRPKNIRILRSGTVQSKEGNNCKVKFAGNFVSYLENKFFRQCCRSESGPAISRVDESGSMSSNFTQIF